VPFELRTPFESVGDEHDTEVATLARAGVAGVLGAIVNDFKRERHQLTFQYEAQLLQLGVDDIGCCSGLR